MRYFVCHKFQDNIYRQLWITESKSGIFIGVFGTTEDRHLSYHANGTKHFAFHKAGRREHSLPSQHPPISDIEKFAIIGSINTPLVERWRGFANIFSSNRETDIILLDEHLDYNHLVVDVAILNKNAEQIFLSQVNPYDSTSTEQSPKLIICHLGNMDHFPNHKLAVRVFGNIVQIG